MRNANTRHTPPALMLVASATPAIALGCTLALAQTQQVPHQQPNLFGYDSETFEQHLDKLSFEKYRQEQQRLKGYSTSMDVKPSVAHGSSWPPRLEDPAELDLDDDL